MNVCFDLVIPKTFSIHVKELVEDYVNWGDGSFKQDPPKYCWRNSIYLIRRDMPVHIERRLPSVFIRGEMLFLSLEGCGIDDWEKILNSKESNVSQNPLKDMLLSILPLLDMWAIVFDLNCDQIDSVYAFTPRQLVEKIESVLTWGGDQEGFIGHGQLVPGS